MMLHTGVVVNGARLLTVQAIVPVGAANVPVNVSDPPEERVPVSVPENV